MEGFFFIFCEKLMLNNEQLCLCGFWGNQLYIVFDYIWAWSIFFFGIKVNKADTCWQCILHVNAHDLSISGYSVWKETVHVVHGWNHHTLHFSCHWAKQASVWFRTQVLSSLGLSLALPLHFSQLKFLKTGDQNFSVYFRGNLNWYLVQWHFDFHQVHPSCMLGL